MLDETIDSTAAQVPFLGSQDRPLSKPPKYHWHASRYLCMITILVLLCFSIRHAIHQARIRHQRRTLPHPDRCPTSLGTIVQQSLQKWIVLLTLPRWLYGPDTLLDALFSLTYCLVLFYFALNRSRWVGGTQNGANQMGVIAFSQMPLVFILVSKNNPITLLTGISHRRLNYLHRAASRACILCAWIHAIAWTPVMWNRGQLFDAYIQWGAVALMSYTLLWVTSLRRLRRVAWELFLAAHMLFTFMFLVAAVLHWRKLAYWIWPAAAVWIVDRLVRLYRLDRMAGGCDAIVELVDPDMLRVTVPNYGSAWNAGQYAYLWMPRITRFPIEAHPFTFATIPTQGSTQAVFLMRVHSDATRLLREALHSEDIARVHVGLEGPYGRSVNLDHYGAAILVAGGTGIAYSMSVLLGALYGQSQFSREIRRVHLVWHTRSASNLRWITSLLEGVAKDITMAYGSDMNPVVVIDVHITGGSEETGLISIPETVAEEYVEITSPPRLRSHFPMGSRFPRQDCRITVRLHRGRADLSEVIHRNRELTRGPLLMSTCGPASLMLASRRAVRNATTMRDVVEGKWPIVYEEEPLVP